jgi:pyruvate kinase
MNRPPDPLAKRLIPALRALHDRALGVEAAHAREVEAAHPSFRDSARNLLHYLGLRQVDLRQTQKDLALLGLSRLGRSEAYALSNLEAVLAACASLAGQNELALPRQAPVDAATGAMRLAEHTRELLGTPAGKRSTRIMVTMPSAAADDPRLIADLLAAGMDVMRINCAHDGADAWLRMIDNLRRAQAKSGRPCKVYADLAGPKLRTGPLEPVGRLLSFGPKRDLRGGVTEPARLLVVPRGGEANCGAGVPVIPVDAKLLQKASPGDLLMLQDCRGDYRPVTLGGRDAEGVVASAERRIYLEQDARCRLERDGRVIARGSVGPLPEVVLPLVLRPGDMLELTPPGTLGEAAQQNRKGHLRPARMPCSLAEAFGAVREGERVWFDDGKIGGIVRESSAQAITVEITQARGKGAKLRPEKGINFPDSELPVPALTPDDLSDLAAMAPHVDIVGLSFVRRPQDVLALQERLRELDAGHVGTVLKIETRQAFESLPRLLLAAMRSPPVGVMVARGDLAVEVGFERLAELQEEILWLAEAAHVPVIWATQVLESMANSGIPSRAEVSDAAMSVRAECVMLNKGPYIAETVAFLNAVLERMGTHTAKRRPMLRRLSVSALAKAEDT